MVAEFIQVALQGVGVGLPGLESVAGCDAVAVTNQ